MLPQKIQNPELVPIFKFQTKNKFVNFISSSGAYLDINVETSTPKISNKMEATYPHGILTATLFCLLTETEETALTLDPFTDLRMNQTIEVCKLGIGVNHPLSH